MNHIWVKVFHTQLRLTECLSVQANTERKGDRSSIVGRCEEKDVYCEGNKEDELPGLSKEDTQFLYQTVPL